ncbi:MAG: hypothetical protein KDA99_02485 [Planctomycetales bacterium]|nr:hypothetical protein [Planctomycetales bacterium]
MKGTIAIGGMIVAIFAGTVSAQEENPDYRIRAQFRDGSDESVGNATFRVKSRFMQVYYGGVYRSDEYRFQIELDSSQYADRSLRLAIDDYTWGTLHANSAGFLDVTYRSDYKPDDAPDLPLPVGFPNLVDVGNVMKVYDASNDDLLLTSVFGEEFRRGDSDFDGDVDDDDYLVWKDNYGQNAIGPANGEYTGDNRVDGLDLLEWQRNYSSSDKSNSIASVPEPNGLMAFAMFVMVALVRPEAIRRASRS